MPSERQLSLEVEGLRVEAAWRETQSEFLSLAVAAALAFHRAHGNTNAIASPHDYDDALNIAATALSRLIRIYALIDPRQGRQPIAVDLGRQRFARGATQVRSQDGTAIGELSVRRTDLLAAVESIKRAGLPFGLAMSPAPGSPEAKGETADDVEPTGETKPAA